jgi:serine/threonine protein kinase
MQLILIDRAHKHGVIHNDIKSSNLLIDEHERLVLADFGLADTLPKGQAASEFSSRTVEGTPGYMAPEILSGRPHGKEADYWAAAVDLFDALTGRVSCLVLVAIWLLLIVVE